jgi:hypothetical protein
MARKTLGLFSSSVDQQEQPFVQVNAHRSIWIKSQRVAAIGTGWRQMRMSFRQESDKLTGSSLVEARAAPKGSETLFAQSTNDKKW